MDTMVDITAAATTTVTTTATITMGKSRTDTIMMGIIMAMVPDRTSHAGQLELVLVATRLFEW